MPTAPEKSAREEGRNSLLEFLEKASIAPGAKGEVTALSPDGTITVEMGGERVGVGAFAADRILATEGVNGA